jgi:hypothetical protein
MYSQSLLAGVGAIVAAAKITVCVEARMNSRFLSDLFLIMHCSIILDCW